MVEQVVTQGDFRFDLRSGKPVGQIPERRYLDPEIANEGTKAVNLSDGDSITYHVPSVKASIPDWSEFKSIKKYFYQTGHAAFPAWFYHPNEDARIFKNAAEALSVGIVYRPATFEEKGRYGNDWVWDTQPGCKWSSIPYPGTQKFNPLNPGQGKTYIPSAPNPRIAQNELLAELIPTVIAAVTTALKGGGALNTPPQVDPKDWDEFVTFQAWKKTHEALGAEAEGDTRLRGPRERSAHEAAMEALKPDIERDEWEAKAREAGVKIDGRWSFDRLRKEVVAALEKRVDEAQEASAALHDSVVALSGD